MYGIQFLERKDSGMLRKQYISFSAFLALVCFIAVTPVSAKTIYVPKDHPKIQAAIDAAEFGDKVLVAPGTYKEYLLMKKGVAVRSEGTEAEHKNHTAARRTIIDSGGAENTPVVEGADYATIDGFTLTGLAPLDHHVPGHAHGINCRGTSMIIINNIIHNMGSTGIGNHVKGKKRAMSYIANNIVYGNIGLGIGSNHNSAATVVHNMIYSNTDVGVGVRNGAHSLIERNSVYNNSWAGIGTKDGGFPSFWKNVVHGNGSNKMPTLGAGIGVMAAYAVLIEGNTSYGNYLAGIGMRKKARSVIRDNETYSNRFSGIGLDNVAYALVEGNSIRGNTKAGIGITNESFVTVRNNSIFNNVNAAISPRSKGNVVIEQETNVIYSNGVPYSGEPPAMTLSYNPLSGEETSDKPLGIPSPSFFDWVKDKDKLQK
jgi:parallel beta-helix repeat protein